MKGIPLSVFFDSSVLTCAGRFGLFSMLLSKAPVRPVSRIEPMIAVPRAEPRNCETPAELGRDEAADDRSAGRGGADDTVDHLPLLHRDARRAGWAGIRFS